MDVGVVGLGNIGSAMAVRLARAGFPLTAFDLRAEAAGEAVAAGATRASTLSSVATAADVICVAVLDEPQLRAVLTGPGALLASGHAGQRILVHSTVAPRALAELAGLAAEQGITVMDAAVTGGDAAAAAGRLTCMVGGAAAEVAAVRPLLQTLAVRVAHVGPVGAGMATKLANNLMLYVNYVAFGEAAELGARHGVDPAVLAEVAGAGTGQSWALDNAEYLRHQLEEVLSPGLPAKDLRAALQAAAAAGASLPLAAAAAELVDTGK